MAARLTSRNIRQLGVLSPTCRIVNHSKRCRLRSPMAALPPGSPTRLCFFQAFNKLTVLIVTASTGGNTSSTSSVAPWVQKTVELPPFKRGCHLITSKIYQAVPEIYQYEMGLANIFIVHTSASLTINENASPDVRLDLNASLDRLVPEGNFYTHDDEGSDDMPAHVKASLMGASLTIPIGNGRLKLGTWQGVYLNEHRNSGGARTLVITLQGQPRGDGRSYPAVTSR